jgi:hypothetical protein
MTKMTERQIDLVESYSKDPRWESAAGVEKYMNSIYLNRREAKFFWELFDAMTLSEAEAN